MHNRVVADLDESVSVRVSVSTGDKVGPVSDGVSACTPDAAFVTNSRRVDVEAVQKSDKSQYLAGNDVLTGRQLSTSRKGREQLEWQYPQQESG